MNVRRNDASTAWLVALCLWALGCASSTGQPGGTGGSASGGNGSGGSTGRGGGPGVPIPDGGYGSSGDGGVCSAALADRVRITEIDVGATYAYNEVDNNGAGLD